MALAYALEEPLQPHQVLLAVVGVGRAQSTLNELQSGLQLELRRGFGQLVVVHYGLQHFLLNGSVLIEEPILERTHFELNREANLAGQLVPLRVDDEMARHLGDSHERAEAPNQMSLSKLTISVL